MGKYRKINITIIAILIICIGVFCYLIYSWNFAYSKGTFNNEDGTYIGEFKGKMFNGEGTFSFSNGVTYKGNWKNGDMEGHGIMTFANGSKYEGEFKDGLYNGKGKIIQNDGTVTEGNWENGKLKERK